MHTEVSGTTLVKFCFRPRLAWRMRVLQGKNNCQRRLRADGTWRPKTSLRTVFAQTSDCDEIKHWRYDKKRPRWVRFLRTLQGTSVRGGMKKWKLTRQRPRCVSFLRSSCEISVCVYYAYWWVFPFSSWLFKPRALIEGARLSLFEFMKQTVESRPLHQSWVKCHGQKIFSTDKSTICSILVCEILPPFVSWHQSALYDIMVFLISLLLIYVVGVQ